LVHSFASTLDAARAGDVVVLCGDASSEELEDEVRTVGGTRAETLGRSNGSGSGATMLCLNKMDLVSEECARELRKQYPEAVTISALEGCDALLEEMYRSIASGRTRMEVLIPHAKYAAASRLYGLAEIHAQENTTAGLWMDISRPRSAAARYAPYKT
jgi:GTPase